MASKAPSKVDARILGHVVVRHHPRSTSKVEARHPDPPELLAYVDAVEWCDLLTEAEAESPTGYTFTVEEVGTPPSPSSTATTGGTVAGLGGQGGGNCDQEGCSRPASYDVVIEGRVAYRLCSVCSVTHPAGCECAECADMLRLVGQGGGTHEGSPGVPSVAGREHSDRADA